MSKYREIEFLFVSRFGPSGKSIFQNLVSNEANSEVLLKAKPGSIVAILLRLIKGRPLAFKTTEFYGIPISIENAKGSYRDWFDTNTGEEGSTYMELDYGYIRGTDGDDGDQVDVYLGPNKNAEYVYAVKQLIPDTGVYDEMKVFLGLDSPADAKYMFLQHRNDENAFGGITTYTIDEFKDKIKNKEAIKAFIIKSTPADGHGHEDYLGPECPLDHADGGVFAHKTDIQYIPPAKKGVVEQDPAEMCFCGYIYADHFNEHGHWRYNHDFQAKVITNEYEKELQKDGGPFSWDPEPVVYLKSSKKYLVGVDFDGSLTDYTKWVSDTEIPDKPLPGAIEFLKELIYDTEINPAIFSSRAKSPEAIAAIKQWLFDNGLTDDEINKLNYTNVKDGFHLILDDRAANFAGKYPTLQYIKDFRPWNRK